MDRPSETPGLIPPANLASKTTLVSQLQGHAAPKRSVDIAFCRPATLPTPPTKHLKTKDLTEHYHSDLTGNAIKVHTAILATTEHPAVYSDPKSKLSIPFPCIGAYSDDRFTYNGVTSNFSFYGRQLFADLLRTVEGSIKHPYGRKITFLHGTKGYGKSYLLAILVVYLIRKERPVVYIPDCRDLVGDFFGCFQKAMLLAFITIPVIASEILRATTTEDLLQLSKRLRMIVVADQTEALNMKIVNNQLDQEGFMKTEAIKHLNMLAVNNHFVFASTGRCWMSEDARIKDKMQQICAHGGLTTTEMAFWWKNQFVHELIGPFKAQERNTLEYYTGCIPALLRRILQMMGSVKLEYAVHAATEHSTAAYHRNVSTIYNTLCESIEVQAIVQDIGLLCMDKVYELRDLGRQSKCKEYIILYRPSELTKGKIS
ncbi:hypothetical protein BJ508DRAFT_83323 [Ascobolus immersus RN42]|uniref:Uncharacterized protein n=1 Tax=Ascobolus immersus RN42 TaxID=1160509 RepID=A0A3N4IB63_ASCIM|nr:hypothetical protein BJ508DRAFT_83323 [Ascobolus immersus RN42]